MSGVVAGPPPRSNSGDTFEALEPLQRFLNLRTAPTSLEELAASLSGYRILTVIATISDPRDSRLGYDFDMATEAVQRAIESEGYTLDRFRFPWLDPGSPAGGAGSPPASSLPQPGPGIGPPTSSLPSVALLGQRYERQPGTILFRIDRPAPEPGKPSAPQDLLLLLLVGETPTSGVQQEALSNSLSIAWTLEIKRHVQDADHEPVIRLLAPTFSGTADSLARGLRAWTLQQPDRSEARFWVCSGAATAVDKTSFERNALPAQVTYAATVIPDEILLAELYRFLARPAGPHDPFAPPLPEGKIALLVEGGSGYGAAVGNTYGTSGTSTQSRRIISIPFPSQISQVRASASTSADAGGTAGKNRVAIPLDPPSGRQGDRLPALSPRMTIATDSLILSNILATIASEDIRYVGIVATDILDVIYLTRLIRENCPDVQVILVGSDLRYTDPQFTLDFRGTVIASSYPLDARAQVWSYPFEGAIERRMFANEFDVGRYNAALVLLNGVTDPNHAGRLVVDAGKAEDFLVYGKPFITSFYDSVNRRPQVWISQVGQFNVWPLKVLPLSQSETSLRARAEALVPPIMSLDPQAEPGSDIRIDYDLPLMWKLAFCVATLVASLLVGIILYSNLCAISPFLGRSSWFDPLLRRFEVSSPDLSRKALFLIALLLVAVAVPYCLLAAPLDLVLPERSSTGGERNARLVVGWDLDALACLAAIALVWMLVPLGICLRGVLLGRAGPPRSSKDTRSAPQRADRWLTAEGLLYRLLTMVVVLAGIGCILLRLYRFAFVRPEMPNDWLSLDRSAHLLGGISPVVPVACLGAAIFWWSYLELKRLHAYPLLHRNADLISLQGFSLPREAPWKRVIPAMNARFHLCVDLLEYPVGILISKNYPLAGLVLSAVVGLVVFVWGVVWPRFIATPEGMGFDVLVVIAVSCYLLLLLYSQVRYLWLWKSLLQLFRQISLLPMAGAFDRIPPRVAAKFGRFLRSSLHDDIDLEIPLQQCWLVLGQGTSTSDDPLPMREVLRTTVESRSPQSDQERFEIVSVACSRPVIEQAWPWRSLQESFGGALEADAEKQAPDQDKEETEALDEATSRWLKMAEDLLALRIVYLVSQFAAPLRSMSAQQIYGPILLLLAVAWYPFHPQRLMAIMIWVFILCGVLVTLLVLLQVERSDFVRRVSRLAPGALKLDHNLLANLLPYALPVGGFVLTAFPSLRYWLGSLLEPIGRAVK
jgi:hypothetical protein